MKHSYMSHAVLRLWELPCYPKNDPRRWRVDLCHGGGACAPETFGTNIPSSSPLLRKECISPESPRLGAPPVPTSRDTPERETAPSKLKRSYSPVQYYGAGIHPLRSLHARLTLSRVQDVLMSCANQGSVLNKRMVRDKSRLKMSVGSQLDKSAIDSSSSSCEIDTTVNITNPSPVRLPPTNKSVLWEGGA